LPEFIKKTGLMKKCSATEKNTVVRFKMEVITDEISLFAVCEIKQLLIGGVVSNNPSRSAGITSVVYFAQAQPYINSNLSYLSVVPANKQGKVINVDTMQ
jgi:hypothetical protein